MVEEHMNLGDMELLIMAKHVTKEPVLHEIFVIGGDAKGSIIKQQFIKISEGTKILVDVDLKLKGKMKLSSMFGKNKFEDHIALSMRNFTSARQAYENAVSLDPKTFEARFALAKVYEEQGELTLAGDAYRTALEIVPASVEAAVALAELYRRQESPQDAVNLLADLLNENPSSLEMLLGIGHALIDDNRLNQAREAFERVLAFDEGHVGAVFFAGVVCARQRRYQEAVAHWERVIALDPSSPYAQKAKKNARTAMDLAHIFQTEAA